METKDYKEMDREDLIAECVEKDGCIAQLTKKVAYLEKVPAMYGKKELMEMFHWNSEKARRMLRLMFQYEFGNKINNDFFVTNEELNRFLAMYKGRALEL